MPRAIRRVSVLWLIFACSFSSAAWSQTTRPGRGPAPGRRPFAKPGTPRREERIRYFDVKHVKAELTLATKQKEVRGTVTHTLSPLHPYLTRVELDCAPELKVTKVTKLGSRRRAPFRASSRPATASSPSRSTKPMAPARRSTWRSITPARPRKGCSSSSPTRPIRKSRWRSGPRVSPRIRTTGFPATTTPTSAQRPR